MDRWWKYAVLRGPGLPADLDGKWYDLVQIEKLNSWLKWPGVTFRATNQWEQRDDGAVAVVYRRDEAAPPPPDSPATMFYNRTVGIPEEMQPWRSGWREGWKAGWEAACKGTVDT